jgi:hypothetical protein
VGDQVHDGVRYFLVRQAHGGTYQVPEWMFDQEAGALAIVAVPRLPVGQLIILSRLIDQLMTYSPRINCQDVAYLCRMAVILRKWVQASSKDGRPEDDGPGLHTRCSLTCLSA